MYPARPYHCGGMRPNFISTCICCVGTWGVLTCDRFYYRNHTLLYPSHRKQHQNPRRHKHHKRPEMMVKAIRENCTPEPESLHHLLVTHPSTRLFVRPESWTAEHLVFLDCPPPQAITTPTEAISNRFRRYPPVKDQILHEFDTLDWVKVKSLRDESIRRLFSLLVPTGNQLLRFSRYGISYTNVSSKLNMLHSPKLPLLYNSKHAATVSCPLLVCAKETSRPMFAFIDNTWISRKRRRVFARRQPLHVAYKLVQKMNKLSFDPYNASILIAMAQSARSSIPDGDIQVYGLPPF